MGTKQPMVKVTGERDAYGQFVLSCGHKTHLTPYYSRRNAPRGLRQDLVYPKTVRCYECPAKS